MSCPSGGPGAAFHQLHVLHRWLHAELALAFSAAADAAGKQGLQPEPPASLSSISDEPPDGGPTAPPGAGAPETAGAGAATVLPLLKRQRRSMAQTAGSRYLEVVPGAGKAQLRRRLAVHMYISQPPCGDASIFAAEAVTTSPAAAAPVTVPEGASVGVAPAGRRTGAKPLMTAAFAAPPAATLHGTDPAQLDSISGVSHQRV